MFNYTLSLQAASDVNAFVKVAEIEVSLSSGTLSVFLFLVDVAIIGGKLIIETFFQRRDSGDYSHISRANNRRSPVTGRFGPESFRP